VQKSGEALMKTNQKIAALGVLSLIATIITALAFVSEPQVQDAAGNKPAMQAAMAEDLAADTEVTTVEREKTGKKYILKNVSGFIGIFEADNPETPRTVTGIVVSKLRAADAEMLNEGIVVNGEEELARLLEDFGS